MLVGVRRPMPRRRGGHTITVTIDAERFHLTANQRDDGSLGEVFIHWGKHGTSTAGLLSTYAIALSLGLRHQVPLTDLIRPGLGQFFVPNGRTDDPEIPRVRSAVDYIARRLAIDWLPCPDRIALGVYTLTERVQRWERATGLTQARWLRKAHWLPRARSGSGRTARTSLTPSPSCPASCRHCAWPAPPPGEAGS